ncbi:MAG TPA: mycothiol system anti-sigma-R factor [Streptosporangiaceae bacterium]|jgi:mycothiol system anti-sigma-R factor
MSCGKPHETPCSEVLARVYSYLDGEIDDAASGQIRQHLDECGPCLREYGLEEVVKRLVHNCCGQETVPGELRAKVLTRIAVVRAELEFTEVTEIRSE